MHCHHEKTIVIDDRVAFVGGIDLTLDGGDRFDTPTPPRARRQSAGTTSRAGSRARRSPTSPSTSACAGTRSPASGSRRPRRPGAGGRRRAADRAHGPGEDLRGRPAGATSAILESYVRALPRRAALHLPREPVPLVARDRRRSSPTSSRDPPTPDFRIVVLLPAQAEHRRRRHPRRARRADRGRRRRRAVSSPARSTPARGAAPTRSTSTRRSGSSTTAGSRSAPRTSTSTRSSTTPR